MSPRFHCLKWCECGCMCWCASKRWKIYVITDTRDLRSHTLNTPTLPRILYYIEYMHAFCCMFNICESCASTYINYKEVCFVSALESTHLLCPHTNIPYIYRCVHRATTSLCSLMISHNDCWKHVIIKICRLPMQDFVIK